MEELNDLRITIRNRYIYGTIILILVATIIVVLTKNMIFAPFIILIGICI